MQVGVRTRLKCTVHDDMRRRIRDFTVLNEVSLDRGPSPLLTNVDVFCDDRFVLSSEARARARARSLSLSHTDTRTHRHTRTHTRAP
jgi:hypothetical protein